MKHILFDLFLVSLGAGIGVVTMCLVRAGSQFDRDMETWNLYNWFLSNAQSLVLMAIVVIGVYLGFKREFSKLIGFLVIALIAVGLVFNAAGVKDVLLQLFNKIIGA